MYPYHLMPNSRAATANEANEMLIVAEACSITSDLVTHWRIATSSGLSQNLVDTIQAKKTPTSHASTERKNVKELTIAIPEKPDTESPPDSPFPERHKTFLGVKYWYTRDPMACVDDVIYPATYYIKQQEELLAAQQAEEHVSEH